ncbi:MAG: OmpH family outer membrane protein [Gammaproteobacteria bacterium]
MKLFRCLRILPLAAFALFAVANANAQGAGVGTPEPAAIAKGPLKVGFVNAPVILKHAPQSTAASERLEKEFAAREDEIAAARTKLQALQESLDRDGAVLSDAERRRHEREIHSSRRDLKRLQEEFREDLNLRRNQELAALQQQIKEVIQALGEEERFDLIVTNDSVLFASARINVTQNVLARMAEEFKKAGAK